LIEGCQNLLTDLKIKMSVSTPDRIYISGVQQENLRKIQGIYERTTRRENDKPTWKLENSQGIFFLWNCRMGNNNLWMISREEHIGSDNAYAVVRDSASNPVEISATWLVYNGAKYAPCPYLSLTPDEDEEEEEESEEPFPDEFLQTYMKKEVHVMNPPEKLIEKTSNKRRGSIEEEDVPKEEAKTTSDPLLDQFDLLGINDEHVPDKESEDSTNIDLFLAEFGLAN